MSVYGTDYPEPYDPGPEGNPTVLDAADPLVGVCDGPWLDGLDLPPMRWAVEQVIPEGLTLLAGAPKMGKSWLALDLCLAVASGGMALGAVPVERGTALYLSLEDGERRLRERVRLLNGLAPTPSTFHYATRIAVPLSIFLTTYVERYPSVRLIVVDTLGRVRPPGQRNGDRYGEDYRLMASLQRFALDHRLALLVVHHTRKAKSSESDFVDDVSGTHGLAGAADVVMILRRPRGEPDGQLLVTARDFEEADLNLRRAGPAWQLFDGPVVDPDVGPVMAQVLAEVHRHPEGVGPTEVADATGLSVDLVKTYLFRGVKRGDLKKNGRGVYAPVTSVTSVTLPLSSVPEGDTGDTGDTTRSEEEERHETTHHLRP